MNRPTESQERYAVARRVAHHATCYVVDAVAHAHGVTGAKSKLQHSGRALMRGLATLARLDEFSTRWNAGGPAVSGETYLTAPGLHAWVEYSCVMGPVITFRTRRHGEQDGPNRQVLVGSIVAAHDVLAAARSIAAEAAHA